MDAIDRTGLNTAAHALGAPTLVVDVWSPQCALCLALAPVFERLAEEFATRGTFRMMDATADLELTRALDVTSTPTFLALRGGVEVSRLSGRIGPSELKAWVDLNLSPHSQLS